MGVSSCCPGCTKDSECHPVSSQTCTTPDECMTGNCDFTTGKCVDQTCDKTTNSCTPCPSSDPKFPILQQLQEGKLGFCKTGIPSTQCPTAALICQIQPASAGKAGGACVACGADNTFCTNSGGTDAWYDVNTQDTCMCTGSDWVTIPVCAPPASIVANLAYLSAIKNSWAPRKTPLVIYLIVGLGLIMFLITLVWYVFYLIKHGKKRS